MTENLTGTHPTGYGTASGTAGLAKAGVAYGDRLGFCPMRGQTSSTWALEAA